jgi:cell division protein FtsZ
VLKDGGVAIMSTGYGEGEGRVKNAIRDALNSPLLNDNDVFNSKKILLSITFANDKESGGLMMEEMNDVHEFMGQFGDDFEIKWGLAVDPDLGKKVKVTILATGFGIENVDGMNNHFKKQQNTQMEEERAEKEERRRRFYHDSNATPQKRRPHIFIFKPEDLDNEDVILAVESTPTRSRTRGMLEEICKIAAGENAEGHKETENGNNSSKIVF